MRTLVLAAGLIAAHPAYADEIKVESGAPWRCALTSKGKLPPPGVIAKVSIELGANGTLTTLFTGVMKAGKDTIEQDFIGAGSWRQIGDQLRVELKSFRNTRMTVNGEAVSEERLLRENEAGARVMSSMSWGELKITQLTETRLKFESDYASFDCRPGREPGA